VSVRSRTEAAVLGTRLRRDDDAGDSG